MSCNKKDSLIKSIMASQFVGEEVRSGGAPISVVKTKEGSKTIATISYQEVVAFNINSFSNNKSKNLLGSTVDAVTFSFAFNKVPTSILLSSTAFSDVEPTISGVSYSEEVTGLNITTNKTVTLTAANEDNGDSETTSISFVNHVIAGILTDVDENTVDSVFQNAYTSFTKYLQDSLSLSNYACQGSADNIFDVFGFASRLGTPTFKFAANPTVGGAKFLKTVAITNSAGHTENYDFWRTTWGNQLGQIVTIS